MINVLIVDDNQIKLDKIFKIVSNVDHIAENHVDRCGCIVDAKEFISKKYYDLVILDIQLPNRKDEKAAPFAGLKLLKRIIKSDKYNTPSHIVGITAYADNIDELKNGFDEEVCSLIKYEQNSLVWSRQITDLINRIIKSSISSHVLDGSGNHVVVTVHGIRTFGKWQKNLEVTLKKHIKDIEVYNYSFGFLSLFSYFIPPLRVFVYRHFLKFFNGIIDENPDIHVDIVAHSFGTKIAAQAIKKISQKNLIHTVILAGSVLGQSYPWNKYINQNKVKRVVNDCGTKDLVLITNSFIVPFSGMAGYLGFSGGLNETLTNRFFTGGHDFCFKVEGIDSCAFMEKYWVPLILSSSEISKNDDRISKPIVSDIFSFIFSFSRVIKIAMYFIIIYSIY